MTLDTLDRTNVDTAEGMDRATASPVKPAVIDCDVHPTVKSLAELKPYLERRWWERLQRYGLRPRHGFVMSEPYPKAQPRAARRDSWAPDGAVPGSDLAFMRRHYLDACGIETAILNPLYPTAQGDQNVDFTTAMCAACNEWQKESWVRQEPRLRASVVVSYEDTPAAVAEIERRAGDPAFAQVLILARTAEPLGRKRYWPIYEAAARAGLPVAAHVFGFGGYPVSGGGWPSYYLEEMTGHSAACQGQVASLVLEGVFERIPDLKVIIVEGGFGWLPPLMWRLDKHWSRLRAEVPHVTRLPSEIIREHIWITTQPMEEPERPEHLVACMEAVGWDRLLFATDYPHWDFDDPSRALPASLSAERRRQVWSGNARKLYRLGA